jgi:hypothetical protein
MRLGQRFESARRLFFFPANAKNPMNANVTVSKIPAVAFANNGMRSSIADADVLSCYSR